jgi:hypothetical protein
LLNKTELNFKHILETLYYQRFIYFSNEFVSTIN